MERINVEGGELEARSVGTGEPLLLIHCALIADAFEPLCAQPALADRYRLISYHRRGFAGSVHHSGPFSINQQTDDARAVLRHFGVSRAHVAGHSYGGSIALQLALDSPELVHSLLLLEPAVLQVPAADRLHRRWGSSPAGPGREARDLAASSVLERS